MATSSTVGRLHLLSTLNSDDERSCCSSSSFSLQRSRGSFVWTSSHGKKLACTCLRRSNFLFVSSENMPGRVDTPVDAGIKVSNVEFISDILDKSYRENNRTAPPIVPCHPPADENGPTELDFEIYASNCMANYEPPPPPRIPFSAPFEDYYGEAVGVDYISREEKTANSLLRLLESLNAKKVEDGVESTKKHIFTSSRSHKEENRNEESLSPVPIAGGIYGGQNMQEIVNDSGPSSVLSQEKLNAEESAPSSSIRAMEEVSEQPSISTQATMSKMISADGSSLSAENAQHAVPSTVAAMNESQNSPRSSSLQAFSQEQPTDSRSSECLNRWTSPSFGTFDKTKVKDSSQPGAHTESGSNASVAPRVGPPADISHVDTPALSVLDPDQVHRVASADAGRESLSFTGELRGTSSMSQFYVPQERDLVLGAVTFINDQKVDLEIGAELLALMPIRDLQPLVQHDSDMFFEISREDLLSVPFGESLLVKDKSDLNSLSRNGVVDTGTIVIAEVIGKTIIDGRAILSCKSAAQRLAWHRIAQLMRLGEAVKIKVMQWNEGGLLGAFEGVRAFIPRSELLQRPESTVSLRNYVGRTLSVSVLQSNRQTSNIIASEVKAWMSKNLQLGTVHDVTVTKIHSYGMQVEIDNTKIRGFVHKTNFSKEFVSSATNHFAVGDRAKVMLIKGRDPTKVSFSLADLEKENGLLLRDKEQVFREAEEMGKRFRECVSEQERRLYGIVGSEINLDYQDPKIANLAWLQF